MFKIWIIIRIINIINLKYRYEKNRNSNPFNIIFSKNFAKKRVYLIIGEKKCRDLVSKKPKTRSW